MEELIWEVAVQVVVVAVVSANGTSSVSCKLNTSSSLRPMQVPTSVQRLHPLNYRAYNYQLMEDSREHNSAGFLHPRVRGHPHSSFSNRPALRTEVSKGPFSGCLHRL